MPFILRDANDTTNPTAPRLYGKGITAGRVAYYLANASGARTAFILILCEGARGDGDYGCEGIERFIYAGFELPEFATGGARNWKFHPGTMTTSPVRKPCTAVSGTDVFTSAAHGYANGTEVAFFPYGATPGLPVPLVAHTKYYVVNQTTDTFKVSATLGGSAIDITTDGLTFSVYQANTGFFDPIQGRPELIPDVQFTFSGICYVEVLLPEDLSDGDNEPDRSKVVMKGKQIQAYEWSGTELQGLGNPVYSTNNAWVLADMVINDGHVPLARFNQSLVVYSERAQDLIDWMGGNAMPGFVDFPTLTNITLDTSVRSLTKNTGGTAWNGLAATAVLATGLRDFSLEGRLVSGGWRLGFYTAATGGWSFAIEFYNGVVTQISSGGAREVIAYYGDSSRVKVTSENTVAKAYLDGAPLLLSETVILSGGPYYIRLEARNLNATLDDIVVTPGGSTSTPAQVARYTSHLAFVTPTTLPEAIQQVFNHSPGCDWQDVGGQINILTDVNRTPVHTFFCDPNNSSQRSDIVRDGFEIVRKPPDQRPNYFRYSYRDENEVYLLRKYGSVDRPVLRDDLGGLLVDGGLVQFGVMSASLAERIMQTRAVLQSDLDIQYNIEAFINSLHVAKGDFVYVVDPIAGYTASTPATGIVVEEGFKFPQSGVDTRSFKINVIGTDWYSDSSHGVVRPLVPPPINPGFFTAPPFVANVELSTSVFDLPDASRQIAIQGLVTFNPAAGQRGRLWWKRLGIGATFTANASTNVLTAVGHGFSNGNIVEVATISGTLPGGLSADTPYYVVNATTDTLQLSLTSGGTAIDLSSAETGVVKLFPQTAYQQVEGLLYPSPDTQQAGFEVRPVIGGWHEFKVVTEQSASGISQPFALHPRWYFDVEFIESDFNLVDCVLLRDQDGFIGEGIGFYWWAQPSDYDGVWLGAALYVSRNGSWQELARTTQPGNGGVTVDELPDWPYLSPIDDDSTLDVDLPASITLESITEAEMFAGRNKALVGNGLNFEVLHFQSATLLSTTGNIKRWRLSTFLRSVRGSDFAKNNHAAGDIFVLVTDAVKFVPFDLTQLNNELDYATATFGTDLAVAPIIPFTWTGGTGRPLGPAIAAQWDDAEEDCLITLTPRLRVGGTTFAPGFATPQVDKRLFIMFTDAAPPRIQLLSQLREQIAISTIDPLSYVFNLPGLNIAKQRLSAENATTRAKFLAGSTGQGILGLRTYYPGVPTINWRDVRILVYQLTSPTRTHVVVTEAMPNGGGSVTLNSVDFTGSVTVDCKIEIRDGIAYFYASVDGDTPVLIATGTYNTSEFVTLYAFGWLSSGATISDWRLISARYDFLYTEEMRIADGLSAIGLNELELEAWEESPFVGKGWSNEQTV